MELQLKWTRLTGSLSNVWASEAGSVNLKAWGKYVGFPECLRHRYSEASGYHYEHMVKRESKHWLDQTSDLIDFDTLKECQLAVEAAHFRHVATFVGANI